MVFTLTLAVAQTPGYYLIYGNRDGSTIDVYLGADIEIEVWGVTADTTDDIDLNGDGILDSVNFMHNPLSSNDSIIVSRNGGDFYYPLDQWDHVDFLPPDSNSPIFGYTNHSLLAFADIGGDPNILFNSEGDTLLITILYMRTTSDSSYLNQEVCPFQEGFNPSHGSLLWGMQDGILAIIPLATYPCLYFVDYLAGDANGSVDVNGLDVIYLVNYLKGTGPPPDPVLLGDANGDCYTNGLDVIYLVNFFKGLGPPPFWGNCP
jgi:hypothetical protein